jgi:hypothetical protein
MVVHRFSRQIRLTCQHSLARRGQHAPIQRFAKRSRLVTTRLLTGRRYVWLGAASVLTALAFAVPAAAADPQAQPAAAESTAPSVAPESVTPPAAAESAGPSAAADSTAPPASAESAAAPTVVPAAQPRIQIPVTEAPQPVRRTFRIHDGFYLRLSGGIGFVGAKFANSSDDAGDVSLHGSDMALDLMVGGSPSLGVTVGGGLFTNLLLAADAEQDDRELSNRDVAILLVGPFIDGFPNPKKGWHLGGSLGLAVANMQDMGRSGDTSRTGGIGAAAWGGYDTWIGDDWCVGGLVRLGLTRTSDRDDGAKITATSRSLTLMFTALYQ